MDFVRIMWVLLEIVVFVLHIVALIVLIWALRKWIYFDIKDAPPFDPSEFDGTYDSDDDDDDDYELDPVYFDKHGRIYTTDSRGRVYGPDGKIVKTHGDSDGDIYLGDKYTPRLYDHPDDRLW